MQIRRCMRWDMNDGEYCSRQVPRQSGNQDRQRFQAASRSANDDDVAVCRGAHRHSRSEPARRFRYGSSPALRSYGITVMPPLISRTANLI